MNDQRIPHVRPVCELCKDPREPFFADKFIELANSFELHSFLCECPQCGTLYDVYPEGRAAPKVITEAEARERFPGALYGSPSFRPMIQATAITGSLLAAL